VKRPPPVTIADTLPDDVVQVEQHGVVKVGWKLGYRDAFCRRVTESGAMHGQWFLVPYHVEVLRVCDPSAVTREQGAADGREEEG